MCKSYVSMCLTFFYHIVNIEVFTIEITKKHYVKLRVNPIYLCV